MTSDRLELLLALGIVLVYLLDSLRLLRPREALVERLGPARWRLLFGALRFELMGRRPALANPLRPDRELWRAAWRLDPAADAPPAAPPPPRRAGSALGALCLANLVVVVAAAPALLIAGEGLWFAAAIAAGYLLAIAAATLLVWRAGDFGIGRGSALGLGVLGVVCLPCAPNLLRAAGSGRTLSVPLPAFGERSAAAGDRRSFRRRFSGVLREELHRDQDGAAGDTLRDVLRRLETAA